MTDWNLVPLFALLTAAAFVLTVVGADLGASEDKIISALCAVSVLGAATFTVLVREWFVH